MAPACLAQFPVTSPDMFLQTVYTASDDRRSSTGHALAFLAEESPETAEQPRLFATIINGIMLPTYAPRARHSQSPAARFAARHPPTVAVCLLRRTAAALRRQQRRDDGGDGGSGGGGAPQVKVLTKNRAPASRG